MRLKKKSEITESKYIIDKDNYNDVKHDLEADDVIKIVDEEDDTNEEEDEINEVEPIQEKRAIISKRNLIKLIKENHNVKK